MLNKSAFSAYLKEVVAAEVRDQIAIDKELLQRFNEWKKTEIGGRKFRVPVKFYRTHAAHMIPDGGEIPDYDKMTTKDSYVESRYLVGTYVVSGPTIAASRNDKYAIARALDAARDDLIDAISERKLIYFFGRNTGVQATVASVAGGNTITVTDPFDLHYIRVGDRLVSIDPATGSGRELLVVTDVDYATGEITAAYTTTAAGDYLVFGSAASKNDYGLGWNGIRSFADNPFQELDGSAPGNELWNMTIVEANAPISEALLDELGQRLLTASGSVPVIWFCNNGLWSELRDLLKDNIRFNIATNDKDVVLKSGITRFSVFVGQTTADIHVTPYCLPGMIIALSEKYVYRFIEQEGGFDEMFGGGLLKFMGNDAAVAFWKEYSNIGTDFRRASGAIVNITQNTIYRPGGV